VGPTKRAVHSLRLSRQHLPKRCFLLPKSPRFCCADLSKHGRIAVDSDLRNVFRTEWVVYRWSARFIISGRYSLAPVGTRWRRRRRRRREPTSLIDRGQDCWHLLVRYTSSIENAGISETAKPRKMTGFFLSRITSGFCITCSKDYLHSAHSETVSVCQLMKIT